MKRISVFVLFLLISALLVSGAAFAESSNNKAALGVKYLSIFPGLSGQYWLQDQSGIECNIYPINWNGMFFGQNLNQQFDLYEVAWIKRTSLEWGQPMYGLGYANILNSRGSILLQGSIVLKGAIKFGSGNLAVIPGMDFYFASGGYPIPTLSFLWQF